MFYQDIKVEIEPDDGPELVEFSEEELEEISGLEEASDKFGQSVVSTETEKRGA
jgi:hypothetical protein